MSGPPRIPGGRSSAGRARTRARRAGDTGPRRRPCRPGWPCVTTSAEDSAELARFVTCCIRSLVRSCTWTPRPPGRLEALQSGRYGAVCDDYGLGQVHAPGHPHERGPRDLPRYGRRVDPVADGYPRAAGLACLARRDGRNRLPARPRRRGPRGRRSRPHRLRHLQHGRAGAEHGVPAAEPARRPRRGRDGRQHRLHQLSLRPHDGERDDQVRRRAETPS